MQQIERYGVIALVFLLVTIVAISFWGDSKSPGFWSRLTGKNQPKEIAKIEPTALPEAIANPNLQLSPAAPIDSTMTVTSLGGTEPMTPIETPAIGGSTFQQGEVVPPVAHPMTAPGAQPSFGGGTTPLITEFAPPTPKVVVTPAPAAGSNEYVVQRGDSLARIARNRLGAESRWEEIAALNPQADPKSLDVGQKLTLPSGAAPIVAKPAVDHAEPKSSTKPTSKSTSKAATKPVLASAPKKSDATKSDKTSGSRACVVQKGDTLRSIARRELGDERRWKEIASTNPGLDPSKLAIGARIKLPAKGEEVLASVLPSSSSSSSQASSKPRVR